MRKAAQGHARNSRSPSILEKRNLQYPRDRGNDTLRAPEDTRHDGGGALSIRAFTSGKKDGKAGKMCLTFKRRRRQRRQTLRTMHILISAAGVRGGCTPRERTASHLGHAPPNPRFRRVPALRRTRSWPRHDYRAISSSSSSFFSSLPPLLFAPRAHPSPPHFALKHTPPPPHPLLDDFAHTRRRGRRFIFFFLFPRGPVRDTLVSLSLFGFDFSRSPRRVSIRVRVGARRMRMPQRGAPTRAARTSRALD